MHHSLPDVDHRQHREDKGLQGTYEDTEALPCGQEWNSEYSCLQNRVDQYFAGEDIRV